jgi:SAM-dependent methyltransferase
MKTQSVRCLFLMSTLSISAVICTSQTNHDALLKELYQNMSGFSIGSQESTMIEKQGGNATYGEITDEAVQTLINELAPTTQDVFYDLGSGIGRMTVKMYLDSPVKKSVGIELSPTRHHYALNIKKELENHQKLQKDRLLDFCNEDIVMSTIDDATILYCASTCFSNELMQALTEKFSKLKKGLRILTLRQLSPNKAFKLLKQYTLPMTWSKNVEVNLYELIAN